MPQMISTTVPAVRGCRRAITSVTPTTTSITNNLKSASPSQP
jgi:hypothetical protein